MPNITETQRTVREEAGRESEATTRRRRPSLSSRFSRLVRHAGHELYMTPTGERLWAGERLYAGRAFRSFPEPGGLSPSAPPPHRCKDSDGQNILDKSLVRAVGAAASSIHSARKGHIQAASGRTAPKTPTNAYATEPNWGAVRRFSFFNEIALNLFVNGLRGRRRLKS
jgi:hypothetical protein